MLLTHSTLMLSGSFRRVRRGVATNMRVGFMGARPSMAMMDSPKSRASGPTDMTAQAYVSLDSLARTCPCKRHPSVSFRGRKTGETCQKSGGPAFPPPLPASSRVKPPCFLMKNPCNALARSHEFWYHSTGCAKDGAIGNKCDDTRRRCICALRSLATATLQSYRMQLFRIRRSECTQS